MRTPVNGGDLVDFKEGIIFESEKDNSIRNIGEFRKRVYKTYDYKGNISGIYRRIINYQIKRYGKTLDKYIEHYSQEQKAKFNTNSCIRRYEKRKGRKSDEKQGF